MLILSSLCFLLIFFLDIFTNLSFTQEILSGAGTFILLMYAYTSLKYNKLFTRFLLLITSCINIMYIVTLITIYITDSKYVDGVYTFVGFLCSVVLIRVLTLKFDRIDSYNESQTFLAYSKPKGLQGYFASLLWGYGTVALVIHGREFKFSSGKFVEREHINNSRYIYKKTKKIPLKRARLMLGTSWKWYRNCFTLIIGDISNAAKRSCENRSRGYEK